MRRILLLLTLLVLVISCSTTKLLPEGKYRLASNKIEFKGTKLPSSEVTPYLRQQPNSSILFGWSPGLYIYNWSNGSGEGINAFWEKLGVPPVVFDPSLVESSRSNIANHLQVLGYYDSKVDAEVQYEGRLAKVTYFVEPGHRITIDSLVFDVPGGTFGEEFRADSANVTVKPGDFLAEKSLEAETVRGASVFRDLGYYDFNKNHYFFEADTLTDRTTLYYRIKGYTRNESAANDAPIRKFRIGDVRISRPADIRFRESLLRKFNTIHPGALYSERMVNTTYTRLSALKVFNNVSIEMSPTDSTTVDCDIRLGGTDQLGFKANVEASTNASGLLGFSPQLSFYHKNIFHGGEWLNLGFSGNWQYLPSSGAHSTEFGISASLSFPRLLGYPLERIRGVNIPRTDISASFNYQNRPEYRRSLATLNYGFSGQIGRRIFYQITPLRFNLAKLYAISDDFRAVMMEYPYLWDTFDDHVDAGIGLMVNHTTNADVVPMTSYHYERLALDVSGNVISLFNSVLPVQEALVGTQRLLLGLPYKQYVRAELNLGGALRFGWEGDQAVALHLVAGAGWAYGNSFALSFERQFYCGGASSMRGWQARMLGPGYEPLSEFFVLPSQTGNFKLEADLEYRFPMFWKLEGALFAEAGNVWEMAGNEQSRFSLGSIAADWGLGLRVNLSFILLRLDAGFRIHDPARALADRWVGPKGWFSGGSALHFGVGYPF